MSKLVFEVTQEADGGFVAEASGESIFIEADGWNELRANGREDVRAFYSDRPPPDRVRLHQVRDEHDSGLFREIVAEGEGWVMIIAPD